MSNALFCVHVHQNRQCFSKSKNDTGVFLIFQCNLKKVFPDWATVEKHREVLQFACALSDDVARFICGHQCLQAACVLSPRLTKLCFQILSENESHHSILFNRLSELQTHCDLSGGLTSGFHFEHLHRKSLKHTSESDIENLCQCLVSLNLSNRHLTGGMKLLTEPDHLGFPSLKMLYLYNNHLNREDVESLSEAVRAVELPQLKELQLSGNTLTGCLKDLFGGPDHPGFPSLEGLGLGHTHLNQEDVESLSEAIRAEKLPHLKDLNLRYNDLNHMEDEVEALIAACDAHCENGVTLWLKETGLSGEFMEGCRDKYRNVEIS